MTQLKLNEKLTHLAKATFSDGPQYYKVIKIDCKEKKEIVKFD